MFLVFEQRDKSSPLSFDEKLFDENKFIGIGQCPNQVGIDFLDFGLVFLLCSIPKVFFPNSGLGTCRLTVEHREKDRLGAFLS